MSYRVTDPRTNTSTVFPSESVARTYAKSIKGAVVEPCDTACGAVVTQCPEGSSEAQRESSRDFHRANGAWTPNRLRDDNVDESAAERYMETVTQARLMGASMSDALDEGRDAS